MGPFDFSDNVTFGSPGPGVVLHMVTINAEDKGQQRVILWGETPSGAGPEYLAIRDYMRDLLESALNP